MFCLICGKAPEIDKAGVGEIRSIFCPLLRNGDASRESRGSGTLAHQVIKACKSNDEFSLGSIYILYSYRICSMLILVIGINPSMQDTTGYCV